MPDYFVGVDISKYKHTCCIISGLGEVAKDSFDFANSRSGFEGIEAVLLTLGEKKSVHIMMEATGHYHQNLFRFLQSKGYAPQIKNPASIARFKDSDDVGRAKTDRLDAKLIAIYALRHAIAPSASPSYSIERIRILERAKYFLYQDRARTINHLHRYLDESFPELVGFLARDENGDKKAAGRNVFDSKTALWLISNFPSAAMFASARSETAEKLRKMSRGSFSLMRFNALREMAKASIGINRDESNAVIRQLVEEFEAISRRNDELDALLKPLIDAECPQLLTIPGIGYRLAGMIIGEIGDASRFPSPDKLVRFAGLDVKVYQSGTVERHGKLGKRGSPLLRYALFQAAEKARIHCPEFASFYAKKKAEGKHWICALTHTARKMLRTIWSIMRSGQNYSPRETI